MIEHMTDIVSLLLLFLATARLTRLITTDRLTEYPREWVVAWAVGRKEGDSLLAYLVVCPWCVSVYVGAAGGAAWWAWGDTRAFLAVCAALAASHVTGWLATREG